MSDPVTVTERAAKRIAEIVAGEAAARALRVSVEGGGCSGFQYKFDLVPDAPPTTTSSSSAPVPRSSSTRSRSASLPARRSISSTI